MHRKDESPSWYIPGNAGSEKDGEINVWKAVFKKTLRQTIRQMGQDTVPIWIAALLQYLLITVKVVPFEKVSFSDAQNRKAVC